MNTADTSENCQQTSFVANSELQNVYNFCENEQKIMNNSNNNSSDSNNQHCNHRNHHLHDDSVEGHLDDIRKTEQCKNDDNDDDDAHRLLALELNAGEKHEREQKATLTNAMKAPRETLIITAVNFLENAKIRSTPLKQKLEFLRAKGLSNAEIDLAFQRLQRTSEVVGGPAVINMDINTTETHTQWALQPSSSIDSSSNGGRRLTIFSRIKEIFQSLTVFSIMFAIYTLCKRIIFGSKKKKSSDEVLSDIAKVNNRIGDLQKEINEMKCCLTHEQQDQTDRLMLDFQQFKADLQAIKGLLLNRKNFKPPTNIGGHHHLGEATACAPSIPAWQLSTESSRHHSSRHHTTSSTQSDLCDPIVVVEGVGGEKEAGLADDAGSGSGSSETEVVTKNSDSSLEIM